MDRRTTIKWMIAAATAVPLGRLVPLSAEESRRTAKPYGSDPKILEVYKPGELWPLTFTKPQREIATLLCDTIIPADETSPSASSVGVVDFIDEWISAPYPQQRGDRPVVLNGLLWIEAESQKRFGKAFPALADAQRAQIADDICSTASKPEFADAAKFFAKFRDLTAGGFYTTPVGMKDIGYRGNVPLEKFDGPPIEALKKAGLA
jgi:hypothetical protein